MIELIIGTVDSGKSLYAEKLSSRLAGDQKKAYIATMIPFGKEGEARIKKHQRQRAGKGFITFETPVSVDGICEEIKSDDFDTALLECVSNLVGNEIHKKGHEILSDEEIVDLIFDEIRTLSKSVNNLVIVTNQFSLSEKYDADTNRYISITCAVNDALIGLADRCHVRNKKGWVVINYEEDN